MSELEFPTIDADALSVGADSQASTAIAAAASGQLDIQKLDLTKLALHAFGKWREKVDGATKQLSTLVLDLSNQSRIDEAKSLRHRLINTPRAEARAIAKALKAKLNGTKGDVETELDSIVAAFDEAELLITPQIEKREAEIAEEKRLAAEAEARRVEAHKANLSKLAGYVEGVRGLPAARIELAVATVEGIVIDRDAWEEFADQAEEQKAVTLQRMRAQLANAQAAEAEAARLKAEREEAARIAEANRIEAQRLADAKAELERQQAEFAAKQAAAEEAASKAAEPAVAAELGSVEGPEVETIADRPAADVQAAPAPAPTVVRFARTIPPREQPESKSKRENDAIDLALQFGAELIGGGAITFRSSLALADFIDHVKVAIPF